MALLPQFNLPFSELKRRLEEAGVPAQPQTVNQPLGPVQPRPAPFFGNTPNPASVASEALVNAGVPRPTPSLAGAVGRANPLTPAGTPGRVAAGTEAAAAGAGGSGLGTSLPQPPAAQPGQQGSGQSGQEGYSVPTANSDGPPPPGVPAVFWYNFLHLQKASRGVPVEQQAAKAKALFDNLPLAQKQLWSQAQEDGNPFDPFSPEGIQWKSEKTRKEEQAKTESQFQGWEDKYDPQLDSQRGINSLARGGDLTEYERKLNDIKNPEILRDFTKLGASAAAGAQADQGAVDSQRQGVNSLLNTFGNQVNWADPEVAKRQGDLADKLSTQFGDKAAYSDVEGRNVQLGAADRLSKLSDPSRYDDANAKFKQNSAVNSLLGLGNNSPVSQQSIDQQQGVFDKTFGLTDPRVTAEERLLQEMSQRQQEQDLGSQRAAISREMQDRGVYGGGQELTKVLAAQRESANRRALDEMDIRAQANKRAMQALGMSAEQAEGIRQAGSAESKLQADILASAGNLAGSQRQQATAAGSAAREGASAAGALGGQMSQLTMQQAKLAADALVASGQITQDQAQNLIAQMTGASGAAQAGTAAAGNMRGQSFDESFKTGTAADERDEFNQEAERGWQAQQHDQASKNNANTEGRAADIINAKEKGRAATMGELTGAAELGLREKSARTGQNLAAAQPVNDINNTQGDLAVKDEDERNS